MRKEIASPSFLVLLNSRQSPVHSAGAAHAKDALAGLLSFTLVASSGRFALSPGDFIFDGKTSVKDVAKGMYRGFRQWTLSGRWKENSRIELRLHFLRFPGERAVYFEPEINNRTPEDLHLADLRFGVGIPFFKNNAGHPSRRQSRLQTHQERN